MCRNPGCSKQVFNKGSWSATEDTILANYVRAHGEGRWTKVPKRAGLRRCPRSCRLRWMNYLRPDIKRGNISHEEEDLIIRLHNLLGNRWSLIAGRLPGRTDNEIKNYWNTVLKKKKLQSLTPVVSIMRSCEDEDGNCSQSQKEIRFPEYESSGCWNEASTINQSDICKNDFRDLHVDCSFLAPGEDFVLFSPLVGSENENDCSGHVLDLDFFEEDLPVSLDYDASIGKEASDDWLGWNSMQPCGGANLGSLTAFCQSQSETEYIISLWADMV